MKCWFVVPSPSSAYAPDAVLIVPLREAIRGPEAIGQYEDGIQLAFPDGSLTVARPVVRGDHTAVEWVYRGTHAGPIVIPGGVVVPPTGRPIVLRGASFLRFNAQGLIAEEHRYYDVRGLLEQLGFLERLSRPGGGPAGA
jgi:predicted ester cyclase